MIRRISSILQHTSFPDVQCSHLQRIKFRPFAGHQMACLKFSETIIFTRVHVLLPNKVRQRFVHDFLLTRQTNPGRRVAPVPPADSPSHPPPPTSAHPPPYPPPTSLTTSHPPTSITQPSWLILTSPAYPLYSGRSKYKPREG